MSTTIRFVDLIQQVADDMWKYKDEQIRKAKEKGINPYHLCADYYTTANDLKWRWDMFVTPKTYDGLKIIDMPQGSLAEKCRQWLFDQTRHGHFDMFCPKQHCSSNARFKRADHPWDSATEKLIDDRKNGVKKKSVYHLNDGTRKPYCISIKKAPCKFSHYMRRRKFLPMVREEFGEVTCVRCLGYIKKDESEVKRNIIAKTLGQTNG